MKEPGKPGDGRAANGPAAPRELLGNPGALAAARQRSMSERLELALNWNAVAAELRAGLAAVSAPPGNQR
jgi:hypothetical protein